MTEPFPPKPISEVWKPELVRLPALTPARHAFRRFGHGLAKFITRLCLRVTVQGAEKLPHQGPMLVAINHLGDTDIPAIMSALPFPPDALAKVELYDLPILGRLMDEYGVIWLHRGRPDKRALRAALDGLAEGRIIIIAPEGRYSQTGTLEEGMNGVAFLAYRSGAPVLPVALHGTENANVYGHIKRLKRASVRIRVGESLKFTAQPRAGKEALTQATNQIMLALANLLGE